MNKLEEILPKLRKGEKVSRVAWGDKHIQILDLQEKYIKNNSYIFTNPSIGTGFNKWSPTHLDLLANDWYIKE